MGVLQLCSVLVGIMVGSGIFASPGVVLEDAGSVGLGLAAWVLPPSWLCARLLSTPSSELPFRKLEATPSTSE